MHWLLRLALISLLLLVAYVNAQLYYEPELKTVAGRSINQDLMEHLSFLQTKMHHGAAEQMQTLYPEGFVYQNALYALAWTELLPHLPPQSATYQQARVEVAWAIQEIQQPAAKVIFDSDLPLACGAFYQGWSAYTLGRYLSALPPAQRQLSDIQHFQIQCESIAQALRTSSSPYLESYAGAAWPADGVMCVAALAWHDRLLPNRYQTTIATWLREVATHLDSRRLIPHQTTPGTGRVIEAARGSSQSQLLNFLIEIDSAYARPHFQRYRYHFLTSRLGLPGIQESPRGAAPTEDIDSGPVIWGVGGAASIVGRRTMQRYGDTTTAVGLRNSLEAFGVPLHLTSDKRYLFGALPIADAFIAWSNSLEVERAMQAQHNWRMRFQLLSSVLAASILFALFCLRKSHPE